MIQILDCDGLPELAIYRCIAARGYPLPRHSFRMASLVLTNNGKRALKHSKRKEKGRKIHGIFLMKGFLALLNALLNR